MTDLEKARHFYVDTLGFVLTEEDQSHLYLRGLEDRQHHCLSIAKADAPGVGHIAFKVASEEDLESIERLAKGKGLYVRRVSEGEEVGQGRALMLEDQFGFPVEFYARTEGAEWKLQSYDEYKGAKTMRLDHFNILTPDPSAAYDWYVNSLGFGCTEFTETEGPDPSLWAAWLRRKHTCHDIAIMAGKGPRVHHAGFAVADRASIMDCADVLASSGYVDCMERGPGRHGISNAFFLYLRDSDGNRLELYTGDYLTADPDWVPVKWRLNDPRRQTFWGAKAPESWFNEAMLVRSPSSGKFASLSSPEIQDRPDDLTAH